MKLVCQPPMNQKKKNREKPVFSVFAGDVVLCFFIDCDTVGTIFFLEEMFPKFSWVFLGQIGTD